MKLKYVSALLLMFFLSGCDQKITYSYLMRHPDFLQDENLRCGVSEMMTPDEAAYCQLVERATTDFMKMANTQQTQPEKFGLLVMSTETDLVNAKIAIGKAKQAIRAAKDNVDEVELRLAETQLEQAQKTYAEKQEDLRVLFAILKSHSPE